MAEESIGIKLEIETPNQKSMTVQEMLIKHHNAIGYLLKEFSTFADDVIKMINESEKANKELMEILKDLKKDL